MVIFREKILKLKITSDNQKWEPLLFKKNGDQKPFKKRGIIRKAKGVGIKFIFHGKY